MCVSGSVQVQGSTLARSPVSVACSVARSSSLGPAPSGGTVPHCGLAAGLWAGIGVHTEQQGAPAQLSWLSPQR